MVGGRGGGMHMVGSCCGTSKYCLGPSWMQTDRYTESWSNTVGGGVVGNDRYEHLDVVPVERRDHVIRTCLQAGLNGGGGIGDNGGGSGGIGGPDTSARGWHLTAIAQNTLQGWSVNENRDF